MTIFEALREDHDKQRTLIDRLCKTQGDSEDREALFTQVKTALKHHAVAEERNLYVPLMQDETTQEKARHSVAEHHEIDEMMEELDASDMTSPHWLAVAKKLQDQVHHHLDEEEQEVFQLAGKVLSDEQKSDLAQKYRASMEEQSA
jgi:hemerythrin-like domain-containing protein